MGCYLIVNPRYDGTTNQTNQQGQDLTANIFNTQLYTFITTFGKIQNSFKIGKMTTGI